MTYPHDPNSGQQPGQQPVSGGQPTSGAAPGATPHGWQPGNNQPGQQPPFPASGPAYGGPPPGPYGQPSYGQPGYGQPAYGQPLILAKPPSSGLAVASLIVSIAGIVITGGLLAFVGAILGHVAIKQIRSSTTPVGGEGMAMGGIIVGWLGFALIGIPFILTMLLTGGAFISLCCVGAGITSSADTSSMIEALAFVTF